MTQRPVVGALGRALVVALLAAVALLGWQSPVAHAEDAASCQSSGGVYEYISPGGGGCSHAGGTGMTVLRSLTSVNTNSTGMICQIGGYPSTCPDPVPANDYWAYWFWSGSSWTYANVGAAGDYPAPGSVRAWTFGNGVTPSWTPPRPATSAPATTATAPRTSTATRTTAPRTTAPRTTASTTTARTSTTSATRTAARAASTTSTATSASHAPSRAASTSPRRSPSPRVTHTASTPSPSAARTATPLAISSSPTSSRTGGTPWGAVVAAALVLAAGAGIIVLRRARRTGR